VRTVRGYVVIPPDARPSTAGLMLIEVRDVSLMDAPSTVVGEVRACDVPVEPGARIPFQVPAPDAEPGHSLAVRAHVSVDGTTAVTSGDAVSVTHIGLPPTGDVEALEVPVRVV
jgi:putative lipoprotein